MHKRFLAISVIVPFIFLLSACTMGMKETSDNTDKNFSGSFNRMYTDKYNFYTRVSDKIENAVSAEVSDFKKFALDDSKLSLFAPFGAQNANGGVSVTYKLAGYKDPVYTEDGNNYSTTCTKDEVPVEFLGKYDEATDSCQAIFKENGQQPAVWEWMPVENGCAIQYQSGDMVYRGVIYSDLTGKLCIGTSSKELESIYANPSALTENFYKEGFNVSSTYIVEGDMCKLQKGQNYYEFSV